MVTVIVIVTVSESSLSKSSSVRLIFLNLIILKIKNLKKSESASTKTMSSLESTASSGFASIFFIKNLSGTNYNAGRQASAALSYIYWVLYVSKQYFSINVCKKTY